MADELQFGPPAGSNQNIRSGIQFGTPSVGALIKQATSVDDIVAGASAQYDVPEELIRAVIKTESNWDPNAVSEAGATGYMQLMPDTAKELGVTDRQDPEQNIYGGTQYLRQMLDRFDGDVEKALTAYHSGPENVKKGRIGPRGKAYAPGVLSQVNQTTVEPKEDILFGSPSTVPTESQPNKPQGATSVETSVEPVATSLEPVEQPSDRIGILGFGWEAIKRVPKVFIGMAEHAGRAIRRGDEDVNVDSALDRFIDGAMDMNDNYLKLSDNERERMFVDIPFTDEDITLGTLDDTMESAGYSLLGLLIQKVGGALGGRAGAAITAPGSPAAQVGGAAVGKYGGEILAGGAFLTSAAYDQFLDMHKDKYLTVNKGKSAKALQEGWTTTYETLKDDAFMYALAEAAPEVASNMIMWGIGKAGKAGLGAKQLQAMKNKMAKGAISKLALKMGIPVSKVAAMLGEELTTETITQKLQSEVEAKTGLRDEEVTWTEAFKEVLPQTILQTGLQGGTVVGLQKAADLGEKVQAQIGSEAITESLPLDELVKDIVRIDATVNKEDNGVDGLQVTVTNPDSPAFEGTFTVEGSPDSITAEDIRTKIAKEEQKRIEFMQNEDAQRKKIEDDPNVFKPVRNGEQIGDPLVDKAIDAVAYEDQVVTSEEPSKVHKFKDTVNRWFNTKYQVIDKLADPNNAKSVQQARIARQKAEQFRSYKDHAKQETDRLFDVELAEYDKAAKDEYKQLDTFLWVLRQENDLHNPDKKSAYKTQEEVDHVKESLLTKFEKQTGQSKEVLINAAQGVNDWTKDHMLGRMLNAGLIDRDAYDRIESNNDFYARMDVIAKQRDDFERSSGESFSVAQEDIIRKAEGTADLQVRSPLAATLNLYDSIMNLAARNEVAHAVVDIAVPRIHEADVTRAITRVYENKKERLESERKEIAKFKATGDIGVLLDVIRDNGGRIDVIQDRIVGLNQQQRGLPLTDIQFNETAFHAKVESGFNPLAEARQPKIEQSPPQLNLPFEGGSSQPLTQSEVDRISDSVDELIRRSGANLEAVNRQLLEDKLALGKMHWQYKNTINYKMSGIISRIKDGEVEHFKIDKDVADLLKKLNHKQMSKFMKWFKFTNRIFRGLVTSWNPAFIVRNMWRDAKLAYVASDLYTANPLDLAQFMKDWWVGFQAAKTQHFNKGNSPLYQAYVKHGGSFGFTGTDMASDVLAGQRINGKQRAILSKTAKTVTGKLEDASNVVELAPRLGIFKRLLDEKGLEATGDGLIRIHGDEFVDSLQHYAPEGFFDSSDDTIKQYEQAQGGALGSEKQRIAHNMMKSAITDIATTVRESTIDFAKAGTVVGALNEITPFVNARVQGTITLAKALSQTEAMKRAKGLNIRRRNQLAHNWAKLTYLGAMPTIMTIAANYAVGLMQGEDEEDLLNFYRNLDPYITENYDVIKVGQYVDDYGRTKYSVIPLPKGEVGKFFGFIQEDILDAMAGKDQNAKRGILNMLLETVSNVGPIDFMRDGQLAPDRIVAQMTPPVVKAVLEGATNHSFYFGNTIVDRKKRWGYTIPDHQVKFKGTPPVLSWITEAAYDVSGGSVDVSPLSVHNFLRNLTGPYADMTHLLSKDPLKALDKPLFSGGYRRNVGGQIERIIESTTEDFKVQKGRVIKQAEQLFSEGKYKEANQLITDWNKDTTMTNIKKHFKETDIEFTDTNISKIVRSLKISNTVRGNARKRALKRSRGSVKVPQGGSIFD